MSKSYNNPHDSITFNYFNQIWSVDPHEGVDILMTETGLGSIEPITIIDMFKKTANEHANIVAMCEKLNGQKLYTGFTYKQYWDMCWNAARSLRKVTPV